MQNQISLLDKSQRDKRCESNTFYSAKRFVGRRVDEVNEESKEVSYSVEKSGSVSN